MSWPPTLNRTAELTATRIWSLLQLERQLRPQAYRRRRVGTWSARQTPLAKARPSKPRLARYHLKLWMGFPDESAAYLPA
jgi:hypothetical protein